MYSMRTFESARTRATVHFILTTIVLAVAAFFYVKFYYAFRGAEGTILEKVQADLTSAIIFGAISVVWLINWISVQVKYSRLRRYYGQGGIFGRLLLFLELAGYALFIAFLFI